MTNKIDLEYDEELLSKMALHYFDYFVEIIKDEGHMRDDDTVSTEDMATIMLHMSKSFDYFNNKMKDFALMNMFVSGVDVKNMTPQ